VGSAPEPLSNERTAGLRLHLGCGERYLDGYINIDLPPDEHTVLSTPADVHADITTLHYEPGSVDEVRLHHVFEHFDRPTALRLLTQWYGWLREGGTLIIETPDLEESARRFTSRWRRGNRSLLVRHLFGSHEAAWAVHADGWYEEKFRLVLGSLGFGELLFQRSAWQGTHNITVTARKLSPSRPAEELLDSAEDLLRSSLVDDSDSERRLHAAWVRTLRKTEDP
jgi:predicted SAM-dependent methyltransferase